MRRLALPVLGVATALAAVLSGCAAPSTADQRLSVLAAFYPLQYAAEQVGGERATVDSLTPPGAEPHDVELSPRQVAAIADADLVLYVPGFQPAVDEAVALVASDRAVDVTDGLRLLPADTGTVTDAADQTGGHDHDETAVDPHVWLDPDNMRTIAAQLAGRMAQADPAGSAGFRTRAASLDGQLRRLGRDWAVGTRRCDSRDLVVSHDAFGYLAARFGFTQVGITGLSPETEPSPATIAAAADFVRANGVKTIYYETLVDPKIAATVADEVGVATAVLDPIEGLAAGSNATYLTLMRQNLATVQQGQGCT